MHMQTFPCAAFIKELGRGKENARALDPEQTQSLWNALLDGAVSDLETGAVLMAYRIKGEAPHELAAMLRAVDAHVAPMPACDKPVLVIPTYNGARNLPNLVPLLAGLAARAGVNVLVHGITEDASLWGMERVTTYEVWHALGLPISYDADGIGQAWSVNLPVFMPIDALCPSLDRMLSLRQAMGVRNSAHTLVKLLQPFARNGLLLSSYTHPEYASSLTQLFLLTGMRTLLMRATEGETVANPRRPARIDRFDAGAQEIVYAPEEGAVFSDVVLPQRDAGSTAQFTQDVLAGRHEAPAAIARQVAIIRATLGGL